MRQVVTNNRKIVLIGGSETELFDLMKEMRQYAAEQLGKDPTKVFKTKDTPFPHIENVAKLSFEELAKCVPDGATLQFRAFEGDTDMVMMPSVCEYTKVVPLTPEEKVSVANEAFQLNDRIAELKDEKKAAMQDFKDRITEAEVQYNNLKESYEEGSRKENVQAHVYLHFENKQRVYTDINDHSKILGTEPLQDADYQLVIPV